MINFSYGSNMLVRRLQERAPSARVLGTGVLTGYALRWHKVGQDRSGKCDALATGNANDVVYGVLYEISARDKPALDAAEGLGAGYEEKAADIQTPAGVVRAHLYRATQTDAAMVPFDWYKALVVAGARQHALPAGYVAGLMAVRSIPDPDAARALLNESLLNASDSNSLESP